MRLVWARVVRVEQVSEDLEELDVRIPAPGGAADDDTYGQALCYPTLTGHCTPDEQVLLNTAAVDLQLGTGGVHFVVARAPAGDGQAVALDQPSGGHIMKLRYTPLQVDVRSVEEQGSDSHDVMSRAVDVAGMPVACCGLHSQVPLVAAAIKHRNPSLKIAYVMTDSAALPLALSHVVRASVGAGLIDATISCGQAFGGMYEAVNLHSGLLAARHVAGADIAIVGIGPGVVGTATPFGHGGIAQGEAVNATSAVKGRPVAVLRVSFADARPRHRGVSHHTLTALSAVALAPAVVAVPSLASAEYDEERAVVEGALEQASVWARHSRYDAPAIVPDLRGVPVSSMGRGPADDPLFFAAAYAAGYACVSLLDGGVTL